MNVRWAVLPLSALTWMLAGCESEPRGATQVVVVVGGDRDIEQLDITVQTEDGLEQSEHRLLTLEPRGERGLRLPTSFTIVPNDPERPEAAKFRVIVTGNHRVEGGYVPHVRRIAKGAFRADQTLMLPLLLSGECAKKTCEYYEGDQLRCEFGDDRCDRTCLPGDSVTDLDCYEVPEHRNLTPIEPGQELAVLRGGIGCGDGEMLNHDGICADLDECGFDFDRCDSNPNACVNQIFMYGCRCPDESQANGVGESGCD